MFINSTIRTCEHCGYALHGLELGGRCPECGTSLYASHPVHRTGSEWQRGKRSVACWFRTNIQTLRRPGWTLGSLAIAPSRDYWLLFINGLASGLAFIIWWIPFAIVAALAEFNTHPRMAFSLVPGLLFAGPSIGVLLLAWCYQGILILAALIQRWRGFPTTRRAQMAVLAHASAWGVVGACVLGLLSAGAFLCWIELHQPVPTPAWVSQLLPWGILTSLLIVTAPMNIFLFQGLAVMSRANLQEDGR